MRKTGVTEKIETYGVKKCSKCGVEFPNMENYFYVTKGTKDGLRSDCKRCQDTQKLRRKVSHLKELETVSVAEAREAEIKELKKLFETGEKKITELENVTQSEKARNEGLAEGVFELAEKHSKSRMWNYVLGVCLAVVTIGAGAIIFL